MDNIKISYAIPVCNEIEEITQLITLLIGTIREEDEIVVQFDSKSGIEAVKVYLDIVSKIRNNIKVIQFPLDGDFSEFKNNLKNHCSGDWIYQIDADELISAEFIEVLPQILSSNEVDVMLVPRINTVKGITDEWISKWGWRVQKMEDHYGDEWVINFPDYQYRILKNKDTIKWENKVHEVLSGFTEFTVLPTDHKYCIYHHKSMDRQIKQNDLYSKL
jgi:glycosyltransferase involved in cell wall biosynthesis